jgi:uncharacterized protein YkwD
VLLNGGAGVQVTVNRNLRRRIQVGARRLSTLILLGFLWSASMSCTGSGQTQASGQSGGEAGTDGSQRQARTTTNAPKKRTGTWHHFGESDSASAAQPRPTGSWRRFGTPSSAPKASPRASTARQQYTTSRIGDLEEQMYGLINRDRLNPANAGETGRAQPLRWNEKLAAIARAHSRDMIQRGYFDHVDPDGRSAGDRLRAAGISWQSVGENIAMYNNVPEAETAFMSEPRFQHNHRWNILNSKYTDVGIGIVQGRDGHYYITQEFMQNPESLESSAEASPGGERTRQAARSAQ